PLDTAKALMEKALSQLRPDDAFMVLDFAESSSSLAPELLLATKDNVAAGLNYVAGMSGRGGTNMQAGIEAALDLPGDPKKMRIVLFLTDGYIGDEAEIFALVERKIGDARIFSLGVGSSPNRHLLDGLARTGRGAVTYAALGEDVDPVIDRFYQRIATPVLADIEIDWGNLAISEIYPDTISDLFAGQPITVYGRYSGQPKGKVQIRAKARGRELVIPVDFDLPAATNTTGVASMWARSKVDALLADPQAKQEVIDLALEYRLLTEFTSFVAVDEHAVVEPNTPTTTIMQPLEPPVGTEAPAMKYLEKSAKGLQEQQKRAERERRESLLELERQAMSAGGPTPEELRDYEASYDQENPLESRPEPEATLTLADIDAGDDIDATLIRALANAHFDDLRACHEAALDGYPVREEFVVTVKLDGKGKVVAVSLGAKGFDSKFGKCMKASITTWRFPAPKSGKATKVYLDFASSLN
ncbi:MAG: AgmX/PglI C-terminal domain-containing protein, partial [Deltaproteobacteria bacterium]|nr:AgmX/PglI C-terminal domain-containing protein [Deltaproteobacteria bacterium]